MIAVAVPHPHGRRQSGQQFAAGIEFELRKPVFAARGGLHLAPQLVGQQLQPVADAERGNIQLEDAIIAGRRGRIVDRRRPARENQGLRAHPHEILEGNRARHDHRVHLHLADAPGDELRVLGPEIEDDDGASGLSH